MRPSSPGDHAPDCGRIDMKAFSQTGISPSSRGIEGPNLHHLGLCKTREMNRFTSRATLPVFTRAVSVSGSVIGPSFRNAVTDIFKVSPKKQVRRTNARRIVAAVTNQQVRRNISPADRQGASMGKAHRIAKPKHSIPAPVFCGRPQPAGIAFCYLRPESDLAGFGKRCSSKRSGLHSEFVRIVRAIWEQRTPRWLALFTTKTTK